MRDFAMKRGIILSLEAYTNISGSFRFFISSILLKCVFRISFLHFESFGRWKVKSSPTEVNGLSRIKPVVRKGDLSA